MLKERGRNQYWNEMEWTRASREIYSPTFPPSRTNKARSVGLRVYRVLGFRVSKSHMDCLKERFKSV